MRQIDWEALASALLRRAKSSASKFRGIAAFSQVARNIANDRIPDRAAQMSFYFFLSIFPFLLILVASLGLFLDAQSVLVGDVPSRLMLLLPPSILRVYSDLIQHLAAHADAPLALGAIVAIWGSTSGMAATIEGLDQAFEFAESRSWWKRRLVGLMLTLSVLAVVATTLLLFRYGVPAMERLSEQIGLDGAFGSIWRLGRWPLLLVITMLVLDLLYFFGPSRRPARWRWFPAGTRFAMLLWLFATLGLRFYMTHFGNYSVIYGAIGGVIVVLIWFYLTAVAILVGAEINAYQERRSRNGEQEKPAPTNHSL